MALKALPDLSPLTLTSFPNTQPLTHSTPARHTALLAVPQTHLVYSSPGFFTLALLLPWNSLPHVFSGLAPTPHCVLCSIGALCGYPDACISSCFYRNIGLGANECECLKHILHNLQMLSREFVHIYTAIMSIPI